ncbi:uncharacterized protein LOC143292545 isoform X2 [Babylonia areolata]|uniref:uncharacterized protein LOC143292545 isoform X2 n=1 Tax=Babylonia areolata TaxID=304850 RepID=UPI003FD3A672
MEMVETTQPAVSVQRRYNVAGFDSDSTTPVTCGSVNRGRCGGSGVSSGGGGNRGVVPIVNRAATLASELPGPVRAVTMLSSNSDVRGCGSGGGGGGGGGGRIKDGTIYDRRGGNDDKEKNGGGTKKPSQQILTGGGVAGQRQAAAFPVTTTTTPFVITQQPASAARDSAVWERGATSPPAPSPPSFTGVQGRDCHSPYTHSPQRPVTSSRNSPLPLQHSTTADYANSNNLHIAAIMDHTDDMILSSHSDNDDDDDDGDDGEDKVNTDEKGSQRATIMTAAASVSTSLTTTMTTTIGATMVGTESGGGPIRNLRVRGQRKFLPEKTRHKRQTLQDMTRPLKQWLIRHKDNPYPSKAEKMELVAKSQMTLTQVSNWFANARRRLKNTVKQPDLSWASRIRLYNSCVEGNAELFSIGSDDSCPDSDLDMMEHRQSDTFHDDVTDSLTSSRTATPDVTAAHGDTCPSFSLHHHQHNSNNSSSSNNNSSSSNSNSNNSATRNSHHSHHSSHNFHTHSTHSNSSSSISNSSSSSSGGVPSSSSSSSSSSGHQPGSAPARAPPPQCPAGLEEACVSFPKYKHSILHRYLSDAHQQALILDEDSVAKSRDRHHSSSTGSRDFEELSTSSVSSPAHESVHHDHLEDFSEEFETMALRRRTYDVTSGGGVGEEQEDMYWKEIGAALALTSLARGRIVSST